MVIIVYISLRQIPFGYILNGLRRTSLSYFFLVRLPKQLDQIFPLANEFDDDESDPVGMTVDEC